MLRYWVTERNISYGTNSILWVLDPLGTFLSLRPAVGPRFVWSRPLPGGPWRRLVAWARGTASSTPASVSGSRCGWTGTVEPGPRPVSSSLSENRDSNYCKILCMRRTRGKVAGCGLYPPPPSEKSKLLNAHSKNTLNRPHTLLANKIIQQDPPSLIGKIIWIRICYAFECVFNLNIFGENELYCYFNNIA